MDIRKSLYTIDVKLDNTDDKYMLFHGYTGAIDVVSENVIAYLDNIGNGQVGSIQISESTADALKKRGYLTEKTEDEEIAFVKKMAELMHRRAKLAQQNFGFLVSYDCNFRCPYCYEAKISSHGAKWSKQKFTKDLVDSAYAAMLKIQERKELHSKSILLYGGEPFLKENRDIVEYIVKQGTELGYHFSAITNGYDLNEYADLLDSHQLKQIQITIDGWKPDHNKKRIHYKDGDTFDKIIENIKMALEKDIYVGIRMNTDVNNFESLYQLGEYFEKLGFFQFKNFNFSSALLVDYLNEPHSNKRINYMNRDEFCRKHQDGNFRYKFEDWGCSSNIEKSIREGKRIKFFPVYCAAQTGSYIFDPFGKIYSCWESIGRAEAIVGEYVGEKIQWTPVRENFFNRNVGQLSQCCKCKYTFLCKGGCPTIAAKEGNEISSVRCNDFDVTFKCIANKVYSKMTSEGKL